MMPARVIRSMLFSSAMIAVATIWLAVLQPGPAATLIEHRGGVAALIAGRPAAPVDLLAAGRAVRLEPIDLIRDPDLLATEAAMHRYHARQTMLGAMLRAPDATLRVAGEPQAIRRRQLPAGRPGIFWSIMLPGVIGVAVSAVVAAADPRALANRLVGLTGLLFQLLTAGPAIVHSRGLAIDGDVLRLLTLLHEGPASLFALAMVVLFCVYPRRIIPAWLLWPATVTAAIWMVLIVTGHYLIWTRGSADPGIVGALVRLNWATGGSQMFVTVLFAGLCVALAVQFHVTRGDLLARAALLWFGLSVVVGSGSFIVLLILPTLATGRSYVGGETAFPLLLFIYAGLTFALLRYRLFEAKAWGFRILFAGLATALLWVVDAAMIYALGLDQGPALGLSVILVGVLYQPARAALAGLLFGRRRLRDNEMFAAAIQVSFAPPAARPARWSALLVRLFDPLEIAIDAERGGGGGAARIAEEGLALMVPGTVGAPGLRLAYADRGTRLFAAADAALVDELAALKRQAAAALLSYDRGAADERLRMAQDLHDDVGARLLSGIHIAEGPVRVLLQDALRDIRTLVTGLIGESAPLSRVIADIRHETATRLEAAGIALEWPLLEPGEVTLSYAEAKAITSTIREVVSNTIRHAGATCLTIRVVVADGRGTIRMADDGCGLDPSTAHGTGLTGIATRITGIGGTMHLATGGLATGTGGFGLVLHWPVATDAAVAPPATESVHAR